MTNYMLYTFPNGRNVFIKESDINEAIKLNKELLIVCNSWSGGYAYSIGATSEYDTYSNDPNRMCYNMYGYDIQDKEFTTEELSAFYKVIFVSGERVMMKTGNEATSYQGGKFIDWDTKDNDVIKKYCFEHNIEFNNNVSEDEVKKVRMSVDEYTTVHMLSRVDRVSKVKAMIDYGILSKDALLYCGKYDQR